MRHASLILAVLHLQYDLLLHFLDVAVRCFQNHLPQLSGSEHIIIALSLEQNNNDTRAKKNMLAIGHSDYNIYTKAHMQCDRLGEMHSDSDRGTRYT